MLNSGLHTDCSSLINFEQFLSLTVSGLLSGWIGCGEVDFPERVGWGLVFCTPLNIESCSRGFFADFWSCSDTEIFRNSCFNCCIRRTYVVFMHRFGSFWVTWVMNIIKTWSNSSIAHIPGHYSCKIRWILKSIFSLSIHGWLHLILVVFLNRTWN